MMEYNAHVEWSTRGDYADTIIDGLSGYSPAASSSDRGWAEAWFTVLATDLRQAFTTALALAERTLGVDVLSVEVVPTTEFDARHGVTDAPVTVSAKEAAAMLGVSPQAVRERLRSGSLPGRMEGRDWRIQRQVIEALAKPTP